MFFDNFLPFLNDHCGVESDDGDDDDDDDDDGGDDNYANDLAPWWILDMPSF